jgi:K+-sensing histidine kinase KdpD
MLDQDFNALTFLAPVEADLERTADRANRLLAVATALSDATTVSDVARVTLDVGLTVAEAARGLFACREPGGVNIIHTEGFDAEVQRVVLGLQARDVSPLTHCVLTGEPVYLRTAEEYQSQYPWAYEQIGAVSATQAYAAVPLVHDGKIIGGIGLTFPKPTAFGVVDCAFMLALGRTAAGALARARSFDAVHRSRVEADEIARARDDILAVVAHDLRNPLNLITGTAQLLADIDLPTPKRRDLLNISVRAAHQMNLLIGDLLDASRIQMGTLAVQPADCSVASILDQIEASFTLIAERSGIVLRPVCRAPAGARARLDESRIVQAFGNLVANALKFTPRGGTVTVGATIGRKTVTFAVTDTGPGIATESRRHLFERFWQEARDRRGVGLGLSIVKGIAEAHGGRVVVRSKLGRGSTFAIVCPR